MKSPIRRTRPLIEFVQIPNLVARDYRLSYRARGLLVELLSYPPGWETTIDEMAARAKRESDKHDGCRTEGRDAMRAAAKELEHVGYLKRTKYRDDKGRWVTETVINEDPLMSFALQQQLAPAPAGVQDWKPVLDVTSENEPAAEESAGRDHDGFPGVGKPGVGEPGVIRKTEKNTDISSPRVPKQTRPQPPAPPVERENPAAPQIHNPSGQIHNQIHNDRPTAAQRAIRATNAVPTDDETAFIDWATRRHNIHSPGWWRAATADLPELAAAWRSEQRPAQPAPKLRAVHPPCACCGQQKPAATTHNQRPYCAACTTACTSCNDLVPTDQLHIGQCLTCLPIAQRTAA